MTAPMQPGDVRVNRANLLRRIGRVCFESGGDPGLPAPARVYISPNVELHFDTLGEVAEWVARYELHPRRWTADGFLFVTATGLWEGVEIAVSGNQWQFPLIAEHYDTSGDAEDTCACGEEFEDRASLLRHVNEATAEPEPSVVGLVDNDRREVEDGNPDAPKVDHDGFHPTPSGRHDNGSGA